MNRCGLKDRRGYRVNDTMGLENIDFILALDINTFLANFQHDWNNPKNTKSR
jgi:hypothetical protein